VDNTEQYRANPRRGWRQTASGYSETTSQQRRRAFLFSPHHRGRHPLSRVRAPPLSIHGFADLPVALCRHPLRGLGPPPLSIPRVRGLPRGFMPSPAARVGPHRLNPSCGLSNDLRAPVGYLSSCPSKKPKAKEAASTREWVNAEKGKEAVN